MGGLQLINCTLATGFSGRPATRGGRDGGNDPGIAGRRRCWALASCPRTTNQGLKADQRYCRYRNNDDGTDSDEVSFTESRPTAFESQRAFTGG